jgi:Tol biopolymer transport system component
MASVPPQVDQIYVVSADGGTPQRVAPSDRRQADPTWSPDGRSLVFSQGQIFTPDDPSYPPALYRLDLETREVSPIPGSKGLWRPQWSPDGRYLAAQTAPDQRALLLLDWRTRRWGEWIRGEPFSVAYSMWSRESQYIYYESSLAKEPGLFRIRVSDRKVEKLGSLDGIGQGGNVPLWMGLAPDDSPLVMRNLQTQEIYALDLRVP